MNAQTAKPQDEHRQKMIALARQINADAGIAFNPQATAAQVQQMMLAQGVRSEENAFSRDIICQHEAESEE